MSYSKARQTPGRERQPGVMMPGNVDLTQNRQWRMGSFDHVDEVPVHLRRRRLKQVLREVATHRAEESDDQQQHAEADVGEGSRSA